MRETSCKSGAPPPAALLLTSFALVLSAGVEAQEGFGDPIQGQAIFQSLGCVRCHAVRGAGGRIGPDLGRKGVRGSFYDIAADMWNHSPIMDEKMREFHLTRPRFGEESDLSNLAAFLYFLKYFDEPGDPQAGKTLFTEKHCIRCHAVAGQGGDTAPRLDRLPRSVSPLRIAQDLWNHGSAMVTAIQMQGLDVPTFQGNEIIDLLAYLRSQGERRATREFQSSGEPTNGRKLFESKGCSRCHTIFGTGSSVGPDLGITELRGSVTQIAGRMWNHWPQMSQAMRDLGMQRPEFSADELADLFSYVFIARYEGRLGDVSRGETVYRSKGCATCHGEGGQGDIGPSLAGDSQPATKERITQRMWNHGPRMWEEMAEQRIPWPRFSAEQLADLIAYLQSLESTTSDVP
ncbi:MAG TPA: c-type cytochrome [Vicinamibacteria bacterium]|nr:c-type cytochrome [Vicinamibacteria bacterium]